MAKLYPEKISINRTDIGLYREIDVINRLMETLPDDYEIFHSVSWFSVHEDTDYHGEIDIIVMGPNGNLVLLEVKAGNAVIKDQKLYKVYSDNEKDIERQTRIHFAAIKNRLKSNRLYPHVSNLLVMPDFTISQHAIVAFPRERIITAKEFEGMGSVIQSMIQSMHAKNDVDAIRRFLNNVFRVSTSLKVIQGQLKQATESLSAGLSDWVPRISSPSNQFRINATAGSGKSQLAITLLSEAHAANKSALYVCFNHMLAENMRRLVGDIAKVNTFHELCIDHYKSKGFNPDFNDQSIFGEAEATYTEDIQNNVAKYDLLIIDEAQDFKPKWLPALKVQLKPEGLFYALEDDDQRIYQSESLTLPEAVTIESDDNFRTPQAICSVINAYGLASRPVISKSPYQGELPNFYTYQDSAEMQSRTISAIQSLLNQGFSLQDIIILTWKGQQSSQLKQLDQIGRYSISQFTGEYSESGDQIWSEGAVKLDSVYRYKGQSMPAVILTEVDFTKLDSQTKRKLFVGLTRAEMAVEIVLCGESEKALIDYLNEG